MKDHRTFLLAARRLLTLRPDARFLLAGLGCEAGAEPLAGMIREYGLEPHLSLLGIRSDLPRVYPALDLACLCVGGWRRGDRFRAALGDRPPDRRSRGHRCGYRVAPAGYGGDRHAAGRRAPVCGLSGSSYVSRFQLFRRPVLVAIAAAAVRFSTPSLA